MSKAINIIQSTVIPIAIENVDTDQIIPARFLKATNREGFGKNLLKMTMSKSPRGISS